MEGDIMKLILKQYNYKGTLTDYFVSTDGDIYSKKKGELYKMKPTKSSRGYLKVRISVNGKVYNRNIHRMVAESFIQNPLDKPEVNHIDGNKKNNKITNLEWVTRKENADHAYNTGLFGIGEDFPTSCITNDQCIQICELLQNTNLTLEKIGEMTGSSKRIVYSILHGYTWKCISKNYNFSNRTFIKYAGDELATKICELLELGLKSKDIANKLGCKIHVVKDIKRRKTWKHISCKYDF